MCWMRCWAVRYCEGEEEEEKEEEKKVVETGRSRVSGDFALEAEEEEDEEKKKNWVNRRLYIPWVYVVVPSISRREELDKFAMVTAATFDPQLSTTPRESSLPERISFAKTLLQDEHHPPRRRYRRTYPMLTLCWTSTTLRSFSAGVPTLC